MLLPPSRRAFPWWFCVNAERFTAYNLALRLVSLGYTRVHWYRGGFESWQANHLPEEDLELQDW